MVRNNFIFPILFFACFHSNAQNNWGFESKLRNGYLSPHRAVMDHLPVERVWAGELSFYVELKDTSTWSKYYDKPRIGISTFFNQTGNTPILGHAFGVFAFGELPFYRKNGFSLNARIGTGIAYLTKVFDQETNPKNVAVSSHFNGTVILGMNLRYNFNKSALAIAAEMTHFSNGSSKMPNLGLNYPFLGLSYSRQFGENSNTEKSYTVSESGMPWQFGVNAIFSRKEVFPVSGKKYPVYGLNLYTRKIFSPKVGVELALDGIYKTTILDYLPEFEKKPIDIVQLGIFAGYVLSFDRVSAIVGMGGYFRDRYLPEDRFYHRIGVRYQMKSNLQFGWTLKSNWGKADYWEWSVGYIFNRKKK